MREYRRNLPRKSSGTERDNLENVRNVGLEEPGNPWGEGEREHDDLVHERADLVAARYDVRVEEWQVFVLLRTQLQSESLILSANWSLEDYILNLKINNQSLFSG